MQLERQFAGPLQDTIIQRWRDPVDGTICYIYLPITAQHSPPTVRAVRRQHHRLDQLRGAGAPGSGRGADECTGGQSASGEEVT
jgi:hypothetical protein